MSVIEHRNQEGIIGAFESSGMEKFAIWQGTVPVMVYDEKDPDYEEGNTTIASDKLASWLNFIEQGGTTAIYTLRVYPTDTKNISNKTAYRAATRFQLNQAQGAEYKNTPDGRVMVIRDNNRPAVSNTGGNNLQIQQLIEGQNKMMELFAKSLENRENDRIGKLIGFLEESARQPPKETMEDKFMKLGELIVEKPDIIDRIGYIFRPQLYSREPAAEPIAGTTQQKEPEKPQPMAEHEETPLTAEEEAALTDRMNAALDVLEGHIGLETLTEALEKLSKNEPGKLNSLLKWL
jgi:hypothetical protein